MTPGESARAMRDLPEPERNAAIDNSPNVVDLRAQLNQRRRNRNMAAFYRQAFSSKSPDGVA